MNTLLRGLIIGTVFVGLALYLGRQGSRAHAEDIPTYVEVAKAATTNTTAEATASAPVPSKAASTNAPAAAPDAVTPDTLQPKPALAEVIRLLQGGVSEDVLMAYITNSSEIFNIGANEILYLHDLGAP